MKPRVGERGGAHTHLTYILVRMHIYISTRRSTHRWYRDGFIDQLLYCHPGAIRLTQGLASLPRRVPGKWALFFISWTDLDPGQGNGVSPFCCPGVRERGLVCFRGKSSILYYK